MTSVRIWTLESDYDAGAVKCLANKLAGHLQLGNLSIQLSGKKALNAISKRNSNLKRKRKKASLSEKLEMALQNYLAQDACVIFVIDTDGPMSLHQQEKGQNSLVGQIRQVIKDSRFDNKVFLVQVVQELEAWLLIDCVGIFCYFASQNPRYRKISRERILENKSFKRLIRQYHRGNTEKIVETAIGGGGAKEHLIEFSERILYELNPSMPSKNIIRQRYRESICPEVAEHILIDARTLGHNNSFKALGNILTQFNSKIGT